MKNDDESQIMSMMQTKIKDIMENYEIPPIDSEIMEEVDKIYEDYKARAYKE